MDNTYPLTNKHLWSLIDYRNPNIIHKDYLIVKKINKEYFYQYVDKQMLSLHLYERNMRLEGIRIQINNLYENGVLLK